MKREFIAHKRTKDSKWLVEEYSESADLAIDAIAPDRGNFAKKYLVDADYCESLEREVKALREICESCGITLKSYSLPNRIRDEREAGKADAKHEAAYDEATKSENWGSGE